MMRWCLLPLLALCGFAVHGDDLPLGEVASARPFLRWNRAPCHNFGWQSYENYPNHESPYIDTPRAHYDSSVGFTEFGRPI